MTHIVYCSTNTVIIMLVPEIHIIGGINIPDADIDSPLFISGVAKFSCLWLIPKEAEKPAGGRLRNKKRNISQEGNI